MRQTRGTSNTLARDLASPNTALFPVPGYADPRLQCMRGPHLDSGPSAVGILQAVELRLFPTTCLGSGVGGAHHLKIFLRWLSVPI